MNKEIRDYITRMVPDIARKCGCKDEDVWSEMYYLSKLKTLTTHGTIQSY